MYLYLKLAVHCLRYKIHAWIDIADAVWIKVIRVIAITIALKAKTFASRKMYYIPNLFCKSHLQKSSYDQGDIYCLKKFEHDATKICYIYSNIYKVKPSKHLYRLLWKAAVSSFRFKSLGSTNTQHVIYSMHSIEEWFSYANMYQVRKVITPQARCLNSIQMEYLNYVKMQS